MEEIDTAAVCYVFDRHPLPAVTCRIGPFQLDSAPLPHFVPNAGIRLSTPEWTIAYTGDTGPDPTLVELGRDADLYIVEATDRYQHAATPPPTHDQPLDLSARDAGAAATAARARRLMLTHFWPGNDRERSRTEAAAHFTGPILLADEGLDIPLC